MRRETRALKSKAIDSIVLAIELFNRPDERGRVAGVLICADHSFEMLLKAIVHQRRGVIRKPGESKTIGFKECVRLVRHEPKIACITYGQQVTLLALNGWRDATQHYLLELSEQALYVAIQGAVTLFDDLLESVFDDRLAAHVPGRVLPVSTEPPKDLTLLLQDEFALIGELVKPGTRKSGDAKARLRTIAILEAATAGDDEGPTDEELDAHLRDLKSGRDWRDLFPGVASLELSTSGSGLTFSLRISKKEGMPIHFVAPDSPAAAAGAAVVEKRVNELGWYCWGFRQLGTRYGLTDPKLRAVMDHLGLLDDPDCVREFVIGSQKFRRYSQKADQRLASELPALDVETIWAASRRAHE